MLDQLPSELLDVIYHELEGVELCVIAAFNHYLNVTSLHHLFARNQIFNPTESYITVTSERSSPNNELSAVVQGLAIASSLPFSPRLLHCKLDSPHPQFYKDLFNLRRFIEKVNSIERLTLDLQYNTDIGVRWNRSPSERDGIRIQELLDLVLSKCPQCRDITFLNGQRALGFGGKLWSPKFSLLPRSSQLSNLRVLNVHSPTIFHAACLEWGYRLLTLPSVEVLSLRDTQKTSWEWEHILPQIHLPRLKELYLNNTPMDREDVTAFLTRHRSLVQLDLGYYGPSDWTMKSSPPWFFLPNVTMLAASPNFLGYHLRGWTVLPRLRELIINMTVHTNLRFNLSQVLDKVQRRLRSLDVTLRLSLYGGGYSTLWLQPHSDEAQYTNHSCSHLVKKLVIVLVVQNFLCDEREIDWFSVWMKRFKAVESITIESDRGGRWITREKIAKLAQSLLKPELELKVRTLQLNNERKSLEEWLGQ